jgi:hypothetical protein
VPPFFKNTEILKRYAEFFTYSGYIENERPLTQWPKAFGVTLRMEPRTALCGRVPNLPRGRKTKTFLALDMQ